MDSRRVLISLSLFVMTTAVYWPVIGHEFVHYDDFSYIVENPRLRPAGGLWETLSAAFEPALANWNPLTQLSLQLDHAIHGLSSSGVHFANLLLHAIATVLLFQALLSLSGALWPSALASLVFGVHPLHVESVAWAAERKDVLCAVFFMTTLWSYAAWRRVPTPRGYALVAISMVLALLAKPMAVTLPFVLLLLDFWPLGRLVDSARDRAPLQVARLLPLVVEKIPFFIAVLGISAITVWVQDTAGAVESLDRLSLWARLGNAVNAYVAYLLATFWPVDLAVFYPQTELGTGRILACVGLLLAITVGALQQARTRPYLLVGWLWFLGTLVPVIGLVQVGLQARADRYMYLPQIGLTIACFWTLAELPRRHSAARIPLALLTILLTGTLLWITHLQVGYWRNTTALFERALAVAPESFLAHRGLADAQLRANRLEDASLHYREAARLQPQWALPHVGIADILVKQDELEAALPHYEKALSLDPNQTRAMTGLGLALVRLNRFDEAQPRLARSLTVLEAGGLLGGRGGPPHFGLARIAGARKDRAAEIAHYQAGLALAPAAARYRVDLGLALVRTGRMAEARRQFDLAEAGGIVSAELLGGRGIVADQTGDLARAVDLYTQALALRPGWSAIQNNLAWILSTAADPQLRDPTRALQLATAAADASERRDPGVLDTLAAAEASAGNFAAAVATEREALALAREVGADALARELTRHLALYEAGKPYSPPQR